eukprot:scaffold24543_cov195-Amphora_coffeaeformis.AAC.18
MLSAVLPKRSNSIKEQLCCWIIQQNLLFNQIYYHQEGLGLDFGVKNTPITSEKRTCPLTMAQKISISRTSLCFVIRGVIWLLIWLPMASTQLTSDTLQFGFINGGSTFFDPVVQGWEERCQELKVTCHIRKPVRGPCGPSHAEMFRELLFNASGVQGASVDGIVLRPCDDGPNMEPLILQATQMGVPVLTFDQDVPNSTRTAYVGTDNEFLGQSIARLLRQLRPEGGTFAVIAPKSGDQGEARYRGFHQEITRYNDDDDWSHWTSITAPDYTAYDRAEYYIQMVNIAQLNPTAMIIMQQTPMRHENWTLFVEQNRHRNITIIGTDGSDYQLDYLHRRYVDGLVGQLPYEFGTSSAQAIYNLVTLKTLEGKEFIPTNVVAYSLIPIDLPPVKEDKNTLGKLSVTGYTCFSIVFITASLCAIWTHKNRASAVVNIAQPFFLLMVAGGVALLACAIVPLSMDDEGKEEMSPTKRVGICMSIPWFASTGFVVTFSALFSKTWRVNKLMRAQRDCTRIVVKEREVLGPFSVLLLLNVVVLLVWTLVDPLTFVRRDEQRTDYWNRVVSSYGSCRSDHGAEPFLIPLGVINLSLVAVACWQAFEARGIHSAFAEAKYIGLAILSMFQAFLTGVPIIVIAKDAPESFYLALVFFLFTLCMAILLLIFVPKMLSHRRFQSLSPEEQTQEISKIIKSGKGNSKFSSSTTGLGVPSSTLVSRPVQLGVLPTPSSFNSSGSPQKDHGPTMVEDVTESSAKTDPVVQEVGINEFSR